MGEINIFEDSWIDDGDIKIIKLIWKIKSNNTNRRHYVSPLFATSAPDTLGNWRIHVDEHNNDISVRIFQKNSAVKPTHVAFYFFNGQYKITLRLVCKCDGDEYYAKYHDSSEEYDDIIQDVEYDDTGNVSYMLNNGISTLCEIVIKVASENKNPSKFVPPPCQLVEDLGNLLSSKTLSDVTIAVGGAELRAHKAVLAARSAVFAAMFNNQMREKETSVVEVDDMDAEVFQAMLEFMYTGKLISQTCGAHDLLLAAATKYQLEGLKSMCEEALSETLSLDNVLENLTLADLHNAPRLKEQCISLIMQHKAEVLRTSSWNNLKRSQHSLVIEVLEKILLKD